MGMMSESFAIGNDTVFGVEIVDIDFDLRKSGIAGHR